MKILIFSDLHGNSTVLDHLSLKFKDYDSIYCLGDIFHKYEKKPTSQELKVIANIITKNKITCLPGNCDVLTDKKRISFILTEDHKLILTDKHTAILTHGQFMSDSYIEKTTTEFGSQIIIYGHTHIYRLEIADGILLVNPGSLAYPRNSLELLSYLSIIEEGSELIFNIHNAKTHEIIESLNLLR